MLKRIEVTQEHIQNGRRDHPFQCPISLALYDATGQEFGVTAKKIRIGKERVPSPAIVSEFVRAYDHRGPSAVAPIAFDLEVPDHA